MEVSIERLKTGAFFEREYPDLKLLLDTGLKSFSPQLGWVNEAIAWMEFATGRRFSSSRDIEQWNSGGGFHLFRIHSDDGRRYWLKATGEPNKHEFLIIKFLSRLDSTYLPRPVAFRPEWNAWLSEDGGCPLPDVPGQTELALAARNMAQLQLRTVGLADELLDLGAFDQRLPALRSRVTEVVEYLIDAMDRQTSVKTAPLSRGRLLELGDVIRAVCFRLEGLDIPDALIHNDLNPGNILFDGANLVFTDWSEAGVGNPFFCCERLCQLNPLYAERVRDAYRDCWSLRLNAKTVEAAGVLIPLLAVYAHLCGRGDSLLKREKTRPGFGSYARTLARHMDRAAKVSSLLEYL